MSVITIEAKLTVEHEELAEPSASPVEFFDPEGFRATRFLKCEWPDRITLARDLMGKIDIVGPDVHVTLPHRYPHGFPEAFVVRVAPVPIGQSSRGVQPQAPEDLSVVIAWPHAHLAVEYETALPEGGNLPNTVTETLEPTAEFITMGIEGLQWAVPSPFDSGFLKEDEAPGVLSRSLDWVYSIHQTAIIPEEAITLSGFVNAVAITSQTLGRTFAPETLLYHGGVLRRETNAFGGGVWALVHRFTIRRLGWNLFLRAGFVDPQAILYNDVPWKPYPLGDFQPLLIFTP